MEKEMRVSSMEQLAKQLGVAEEIICHHQFMVAFKSFICSVCNNSDSSILQDLIYEKRIEHEMHWNIHLSKEEVEGLLKQIQDLQYLPDSEVAKWLNKTHVESNETKAHPAIMVDEEKKAVYFQEVSKSGTDVFREPKIVAVQKYSTDEERNFVLESSYQYDTYSTAERKIMDPDNKIVRHTWRQYDKDGKQTAIIDRKEDEKQKEL